MNLFPTNSHFGLQYWSFSWSSSAVVIGDKQAHWWAYARQTRDQIPCRNAWQWGSRPRATSYFCRVFVEELPEGWSYHNGKHCYPIDMWGCTVLSKKGGKCEHFLVDNFSKLPPKNIGTGIVLLVRKESLSFTVNFMWSKSYL